MSLTLTPGKFYLSRSRDVWCCFRAIRNPAPTNHAAAFCIFVRTTGAILWNNTGQAEYFFSNGSYAGGGEHRHDLLEELPADAGYTTEK